MENPEKSDNGYKFEKRINILNDLRYFKNLRYLFDAPDNPKETKEKSDRFAGGGIVYGKIGGVEARIELTKSRPGYLSVKNSDEELYTARKKVLDDIIRGRVKLS